MKKLITLLLLGITIVSCNLSEKKAKKDREQIIKNNMDLVTNNFTKKYNITYQWDTLHYTFSVDYKYVIETKYQLINQFELIDIYEKQGISFVSIKAGAYQSFYFDFPITKEQENIFSK
jgi:hypothetical protein